MSNQRFIDQARADYSGTPHRIARCEDRCGEVHVIVEMRAGAIGEAGTYWLDWIGAELADQPDEFDELPFRGLKWNAVKEHAA